MLESIFAPINDALFKGRVDAALRPVLTQFRSGAFGATADIEKAFLTIEIHPDAQSYLYFTWDSAIST